MQVNGVLNGNLSYVFLHTCCFHCTLLFQESHCQNGLVCIEYKYTIYTKVCGHPFKLVVKAISVIPVADRQVYQAHSHVMSIANHWQQKGPYSRAQWLSTWHRYWVPPFQQVSSSNFFPARVAPVNCKCCYCEVETSRSNNDWAVKL
jgi:hypothetical protein